MPLLIDHDERRQALAEAVWRLVLRDGVPGVSVRSVAGEAGLSTGSVRYLYPDQRELLHDSVRLLGERIRARIAADESERHRLVASGRTAEGVVRLLTQVMPLDEERTTEARIWAAFVAPATNDATLRAMRRELDDAVRQLCEQCIDSLRTTGALGRGRKARGETIALWALVDGLSVRLLIAPDRLTPSTAVATLRAHVRQLAWPDPGRGPDPAR